MKPLLKMETDRLILRAVELNDAPLLFHCYAKEPEVSKYLTWKCSGDIHDTETMVARASKIWSGEVLEGCLSYDYVVKLKNEDEIIGGISIRPDGFRASVGYCYGTKYWGKGYGTEALSFVTDWLISQSDIFRVWATHDIDNTASGRILEKCGYKREGVLRRYCVHPNISSKPRDAVMWAKTR